VDVIDTVSRWWPNHNASVSWLHTFSPTMTNEISITGFCDWNQRGAGLDPERFGGQALAKPYADMLGIPNSLGAVNWPNVSGLGLGAAGGEAPYYLR
jgi:hypothetical protein